MNCGRIVAEFSLLDGSDLTDEDLKKAVEAASSAISSSVRNSEEHPIGCGHLFVWGELKDGECQSKRK